MKCKEFEIVIAIIHSTGMRHHNHTLCKSTWLSVHEDLLPSPTSANVVGPRFIHTVGGNRNICRNTGNSFFYAATHPKPTKITRSLQVCDVMVTCQSTICPGVPHDGRAMLTFLEWGGCEFSFRILWQTCLLEWRTHLCFASERSLIFLCNVFHFNCLNLSS